jgi:hypothetical protein
VWNERYSRPGFAYGTEPNDFLREYAPLIPKGRVLALADFVIAPSSWEGVVSIFCHLPPTLRRRAHAAVVEGLVPGGVLLLEAYTPRQLAFGTGGPSRAEFMPTLAQLREELAGLEFVRGEELERDVREGDFHTGYAAVVQVVARRPA